MKFDNSTLKTGVLTVTGVEVNDLTKQLQAEIRIAYQYDNLRTSKKGSVFNITDFSDKDAIYQKLKPSTRVGWFPVPHGSTIETVTEKLKEFPDACLYEIRSNDIADIIDDRQLYAVESDDARYDDVTWDAMKAKYRGKGSDGKEKMDAFGQPYYRGVYFSEVKVEDLNLCEEGAYAEAEAAIASAALGGN